MKKLLALALVLALALTVVACGAAPASEAPASTPAANADGKTIVYWSMWEATEPQGQAIAEAVAAYEAATGNKVDLQFKGRTGIREGLQPALDANTVIDMFDEDIDRVNGTWGNYLMDLEQLATDAGYEATANAGLMSAARQVGGGTLKSIPYQPYVFAFFYNKAIFAEAGITAEPKTWAEFLDVCEKVKAAGYTPITSDDAYITSSFGYHVSRLVGEAGTDAIVKGKDWSNPAVAQFAADYAELAAKGYFSETVEGNVWPAGQNTELATGTAAMYLNGSWLPNEVKDITGPEFEWGCFAYPELEGAKDKAGYGVLGSQVLAINKNSQVAPEAFELIKYITKGEFDAKLSTDSIGIPADSSNTEWPAMLAGVKPVMDGLTNRYTWAAGAENNPDVSAVLKTNMLKLCGGTLDAAGFVAAMQAEAK